MEDSEASATYESKKLLYKYQFAFLLMQRSFTSLSKIITTRETQEKYKLLARWQRILPKNEYSVELAVHRLATVLGRLRKIHWKQVLFRTRRAFAALKVNLVQVAVWTSLETEIHAQEKTMKKQLNESLLECSTLTSRNIELETELRECRKRERLYSHRTAGASEKKGRNSPTFEEQKECSRLKKERAGIRSQEVEMEIKVAAFLRQMTEVLKQAEMNKQNEGNYQFIRKPKKRH